jgi:hypothetical protein
MKNQGPYYHGKRTKNKMGCSVKNIRVVKKIKEQEKYDGLIPNDRNDDLLDNLNNDNYVVDDNIINKN